MHIKRLKEISALIQGAEIIKTIEGRYQVVFSFGGKEAMRHAVTDHSDNNIREWLSADMAIGVIEKICPNIDSIKILKQAKKKE